jgi:hypothetical protein
MARASYSIIRLPAATLEAAQAIVTRMTSIGVPRDHINITPHEDDSFHVAIRAREGDRSRILSAAGADGTGEEPGPRDGAASAQPMALTEILVRGLVAGAAGVAAMTVAEKLEQAVTGRPNSYVPGHTLERLLGRPKGPDNTALNWAMHWGQGMLLGAARAVMAERGIRGPIGSFLFLNLRLLNDQTLENATGVGAPPWTWPIDEQVVDLLHKAVYAYAAGAAADRLVPPRHAPDRQKGAHYYGAERQAPLQQAAPS